MRTHGGRPSPQSNPPRVLDTDAERDQALDAAWSEVATRIHEAHRVADVWMETHSDSRFVDAYSQIVHQNRIDEANATSRALQAALNRVTAAENEQRVRCESRARAFKAASAAVCALIFGLTMWVLIAAFLGDLGAQGPLVLLVTALSIALVGAGVWMAILRRQSTPARDGRATRSD